MGSRCGGGTALMGDGFVFVSVDAEGLPFAAMPWFMPGWSLFNEMRMVMSRLVRVVASRLQEHGRRVVVADSHGFMVNVDPLELPGDAELVRGFPRTLSMAMGARGARYAVLLGYHAGAGSDSAFSHTYSGSVVHEVTLNGRSVSEFLLNAFLLGEWGVPVALVAGSEELRGEIQAYTPWAVFVPLVRSVGYAATVSRSIGWAEEELIRAVDEAESRADDGSLKPLTPPSRPRICVTFHSPAYAETASLIPGAERAEPRTVCYSAENMEEAYRAMEAMVYLGSWARRVLQDQAR